MGRGRRAGALNLTGRERGRNPSPNFPTAQHPSNQEGPMMAQQDPGHGKQIFVLWPPPARTVGKRKPGREWGKSERLCHYD